MHYMRDPCSPQTLAPKKNILDCEFRDWIAAYHFQALVEQGCPSDISARRTNELLLGLMGRSGRQLWIEGHDAGTFRALECHTDTFFHEDFVKMFGTTFWQAIPPSNDPLQDKEEKLSRWGGETTTEYEPSESS